MKIGELELGELLHRLRDPGLIIPNGPFLARLLTPHQDVARGLRTLYANHSQRESADFCDVTLHVKRRRLGRKCRLTVDGQVWSSTDGSLSLACLEWGMNWSIFRRAHHLLVIHAANLEREGCGLLLPASPGSGKSTLSAALAHSGWRLFSDELALVTQDSVELQPLARPVCLKNESIQVIRDFHPKALFGPVMRYKDENDQSRGIVSHMQPPAESVQEMSLPASPGLVIFPRYRSGAQTALTPLSAPEAFIRLAKSSFNYKHLGEIGFQLLSRIMDRCRCFELEYSQLAEAVPLISDLAQPQRTLTRSGG